ITVNYNNQAGLEKTIASVICQIFNDFEYIIIDGGSTDLSVDVIKQYFDQIDYWVSEKDSGIYNAMNKGIKVTKGEYIIFLNSGDVFTDRNTLNTCKKYIDSNPSADVFYGDIWGTQPRVKEPWLHCHPEKIDLFFLEHQNLNHQSAIFKTSLFADLGLYPKKYCLAGDHWLFLKAFVGNKKFVHIPEPLVVYDYGGQSTTQREKYVAEMACIWNEEVPAYVKEIMTKYKALEDANKMRLVKLARSIHSKYNRLRKIAF
ncbi:MAG: glycosyltransferase, partial [Flavobacterium sp.]